MTGTQIIIIPVFALIRWTVCGATMGIGMAFTTLKTTLVLHAIGAPVYFMVFSLIYFRKFGFTNPLTPAAIFTGFVVAVDFFLVALVINKSLDMFRSFLGTWLAFILIFVVTWVTGRVIGS